MKSKLNFRLWSSIQKIILYYFCILLFNTIPVHAQFTPDRLVVLQAGDGSLPLSSNGNAIVFKEFSTSGVPGFSLTVPSTGTNALITRGSAISEGHLSLSEDASCLVFGAYQKSLPNASPLNTPAASTLNRGIGLIFANGTFQVGAIGASPFANGDIRGATGTSSANLWASSSSAGASYYGPSNPQSNVQNSKTNLRSIHIFNHQLYISSHSAAGTPSVIGIYAVGNGTPFASSQNVSLVFATGNNSQPCQFYFNAANTICYVADSRNSAQGGIQKWVNTNNTWTLAYTLATGTSAIGAQGIVADFSGSNPKVYATTTEGSNNRLVAIHDLGPTSTATTLVNVSSNNTIFRGLAFSPGTIPCDAPVILAISSNSVQCSQDTLKFYTGVIGNSPLTYSWSGIGNFSSISSPSPSILNSSSGNYSLTVVNACGSSSAIITVSVNPSPTLQVNSATICSGGTATLSANGASTYTWSNGSNNPSILVNPNSNTTYTVNGSSLMGCISSAFFASVEITNSLSITASTATICSGSSATLYASGANSYTWSNSFIGTSIIVSPSTTISYSVLGSSPGCPSLASTTTSVLVNPSPIVTINSPYSNVCIDDINFQIQGFPIGGTFYGNGMNGDVFSPNLAGLGFTYVSYSFTNLLGCIGADSSQITVSECTHILENESQTNSHLYPNPARDKLFFETSIVPKQISIYSISGTLIQTIKTEKTTTEIDLIGFNAGLYFIQWQDDESSHILKFFVE